MQRALVYMTGRNCERYVRAAIDSLMWQTHPPVHVLFVDDASTDDTFEIARRSLASHFEGRHTIVRNREPWGKARSAHVHLRAALEHGDFVVVLDADDQLSIADALSLLAAEYAAGHDVVWTRYETDGGAIGNNGPLDPLRAPRGQGWRTSHCFSFRAALLAAVPESYFRDDEGQWFQAACDFAIAYPVLDQTRRWKFLPRVAYRYTASNPLSHHNLDPQARGLNSTRQMEAARQVLDKPALPCTRWAFGERAGADEALALVQSRLSAEVQAVAQRVEALEPQVALAALAASQPRLAPGAEAWVNAAAQVMVARCPALLELSLDGQGPSGEGMDVRTALRWWHWLQSDVMTRAPHAPNHAPTDAQTTAPRVLEVGGGELAAPLHAMVHAMGGRMVSACSDRQRAIDLFARLNNAGVADAEVMHTPLVAVELDGVQGALPDLARLGPDATGFDVLIVSADEGAVAADSAALALMLAGARLDGRGFRVCLWAPGDEALRQRAAEFWGALLPDLELNDNAFQGRALSAAPR